jgi:hypothetical protein
MRERQRILGNLDQLYREAFQRVEGNLEVALDVRELLSTMGTGKDAEEKTKSLLEKAQAIRRLTRLR